MHTKTLLVGFLDRHMWSLAILACVMLVTADLVGASVTPGYSAWRDTVSHMMTPGAGYSNILRAALICYGVLLIPFAIQLWRRFKVHRLARALMAAGVWTHIVFMVAAALFQNDSNVSILGIVTVNEIHDAGTIVLFAAAIFTLLVAVLSAISPRWSLHVAYSRISLLVMVSMGAMLVITITTDFHGITERVNSAVFMGWIAATALSEDGWEPLKRL